MFIVITSSASISCVPSVFACQLSRNLCDALAVALLPYAALHCTFLILILSFSRPIQTLLRLVPRRILTPLLEGNTQLTAEFRVVTMLFVNLPGLKYEDERSV